jgi:hypothetical protein
LAVAESRYARVKARHDAAIAAAQAIEADVTAAAAVVTYAAEHPALRQATLPTAGPPDGWPAE